MLKGVVLVNFFSDNSLKNERANDNPAEYCWATPLLVVADGPRTPLYWRGLVTTLLFMSARWLRGVRAGRARLACNIFASPHYHHTPRSFTYPFPYFPRDRYGNYLWAGKKTLTSHSSAGLSSINSIPSKKNSWNLQLLFYTIVFILHQQKGLQNHNLKSPAKISCENAKRKISKNDGFVQRFLNKVEN